ncbi:hypothetical protein ACEPAG_8303 [Sanghuangporus baumii]
MSELDSTYGCLFLTVRNADLDSNSLWAVSCLQLWFYIEKYLHTDKMWLKVYTVLLWILDTVYLILVFKFLYIYFVREFGNVAFLDNLPKDIYSSAPFSPIIAAMVQALFVMRAWNLSNSNYFVTGGLGFLVAAQLISTVVYISKTRSLQHLAQLVTIVRYERAMNVIVLITDTAIALVLIYLLWSRRSGFKKTESIINRLVAFTIGTGLITSIMAIVAFVAAETLPNSFIYLLIDFCMAKLYYNCMLASLNARSALRGNQYSTAGGMSFHLDDLASSNTSSGSRTRATAGSATITADSHKAYNPRAIECRVDIDVDPESRGKTYDADGSVSDFKTATNTLSSAV